MIWRQRTLNSQVVFIYTALIYWNNKGQHSYYLIIHNYVIQQCSSKEKSSLYKINLVATIMKHKLTTCFHSLYCFVMFSNVCNRLHVLQLCLKDKKTAPPHKTKKKPNKNKTKRKENKNSGYVDKSKIVDINMSIISKDVIWSFWSTSFSTYWAYVITKLTQF